MDFFNSVAKGVEDAVTNAMGSAKPAAGGRTRAHGGNASVARVCTPEESAAAQKAIPGDVRMFSGCMDTQTSADVSDVAGFGVSKPLTAADKAGGACTNALLAVTHDNPNISFMDLLLQMQSMLKRKGYSQVPQLSTSKQLDLKSHTFSLHNPHSNGRTKAVLIGINYVGQEGQLSGCINDVKQMCSFLDRNGFATQPGSRRVFTDDNNYTPGCSPTVRNIIEAMKWLVQDNQPGDSLFFHYSGHGGSVEDDDGDEEDGRDETIIPLDYKTNGQIRDDNIFKLLVAPLKEGVQMVCVFDCCHSGTVLDLPFVLSVNDASSQSLQQAQHAPGPAMIPMLPGFKLTHVINMISDVAAGLFDGFSDAQRSITSRGFRLNLF